MGASYLLQPNLVVECLDVSPSLHTTKARPVVRFLLRALAP